MNEKCVGDLLRLFGDSISPAEVLSAKMMGQVSALFTAERIKRNLSQAEFAELIDAKQSQVSKWESGEYNFTIKKIAEIAAILGLNTEFRLTPANIATSTSIVPRESNITYLSNYTSIKKYSASHFSSPQYVATEMPMEG